MNHLPVTLLGIAGSLRHQSYNRGVLRAAVELAPESLQIETFALSGLPMFSEDDEGSPSVKGMEFRERIRQADGLLIATPEYNHSIPGVLKNAIDWALRPAGQGALAGKSAAIMGATPGSLGTVRAQLHLRPMLTSLDVFTMNQPDVKISNAGERFDELGNLTHEPTRRLIRLFLEQFLVWSRRVARPATGVERDCASTGR